MKLEDHVLRSLELLDEGRKEEALMHAAISIDGTAKKIFRRGGGNNYKLCLRRYYWLIERFIGEGFNLVETKFSYLDLDNGNGKNVPDPDLADVIYHIFRCGHAHCEAVPIKYQILEAGNGVHPWEMDRENKGLRMPHTVIFALLAVSVFSKANLDIKTTGEHLLKWGSPQMGYQGFTIKNYWGKEDDIKDFFKDRPQTRVKIDFSEWKN